MRTPLVLFLTGLAVFAAFAGPRVTIHSDDNHFVYLADAFLHGQLELTRKPHHQNDWASYDELTLKGASRDRFGDVVKGFFTRRAGKPDQFRKLDGQEIDIPAADRGQSKIHWFVSFPPLPAVLMMPFVALSGYGTNDILFTLFFGALNLVLMYAFLERLRTLGYSDRTPRENTWLTVLFGFGTVHLGCAILGQVWFTALILGVTFNLAYLYFAVDARRPFLAGLALAAAFATRVSLLFAAVFFYLQLFFPLDGRKRERADLVRRFVAFSAPCLVMGIALMVYNQARFGSPTEFGHTYLASGTIERIRDFGLFHPWFITRNLSAFLTLMPRVQLHPPYLQISKHGLSILLTTPALALILWPHRRSALARALGITAAVVAVPIFLYQNTGWEQFGFRFALDFLPYLVAILALGARPLTRTVRVLIVAGVLVNVFGALTFKRVGAQGFYSDYLAEEPRR